MGRTELTRLATMPATTRPKKEAESAPKGSKALKVKASPKAASKPKAAPKPKATKVSQPKATKGKSNTEEAELPTSGIIIEACKQCNAFKTRALKLQELLTENIPDLKVTINPEKPRKGYFEARRVETGEIFVSLPDMKRPFPPLKQLDIDELAAEILGKLEDK